MNNMERVCKELIRRTKKDTLLGPNEIRIHVTRSRDIILVERCRSASHFRILSGISTGGCAPTFLLKRWSVLVCHLTASLFHCPFIRTTFASAHVTTQLRPARPPVPAPLLATSPLQRTETNMLTKRHTPWHLSMPHHLASWHSLLGGPCSCAANTRSSRITCPHFGQLITCAPRSLTHAPPVASTRSNWSSCN